MVLASPGGHPMRVNVQGCKLDAVLVLRIQNGNDIFLSVTGTYAPSFFGVSLPSLASLPRCIHMPGWLVAAFAWHKL